MIFEKIVEVKFVVLKCSLTCAAATLNKEVQK